MFCSKCGTETPDDSQFCRKCGQRLVGATIPTRVAETKPLVRAPFVVAGVLFISFLIYIYNVNQNSTASRGSSPNPVERLTKQQKIVTVKNPALSINALNFAYFKLDVPSGATSVLLNGNFTASGGIGNDIEVFVLPESDFVNWQNKHAAKTFYNSGKVTVGSIKAMLPPDAATYYLVFNNRYSLLAQKMVDVDATLTYYQ